ncbi:MAG: helix-turn-helix domain-containing protein [Bacillota bacterium]
MGKKIDKIDPAIIPALQNYDWPGNIRELQNIAERMACIFMNGKLHLEDLPQEILDGGRKESPLFIEKNKKPDAVSINRERQRRKEKMEAFEKKELVELLFKCGGNITQVAREMGVSRNTIYRKINTYGIER